MEFAAYLIISAEGDVGEDDAEIVEQEGAVEAAHNLAGLFAFNAYDHPVGGS